MSKWDTYGKLFRVSALTGAFGAVAGALGTAIMGNPIGIVNLDIYFLSYLVPVAVIFNSLIHNPNSFDFSNTATFGSCLSSGTGFVIGNTVGVGCIIAAQVGPYVAQNILTP